MQARESGESAPHPPLPAPGVAHKARLDEQDISGARALPQGLFTLDVAVQPVVTEFYGDNRKARLAITQDGAAWLTAPEDKETSSPTPHAHNAKRQGAPACAVTRPSEQLTGYECSSIRRITCPLKPPHKGRTGMYCGKGSTAYWIRVLSSMAHRAPL